MKLYTLVVCCLLNLVFPALKLSAQNRHFLEGRVTNAITKEPLAFVSILINNGPNGATTDIDGKFRIRSQEPVKSLRFTYVGYEPLVYVPQETSGFLNISIKPVATSLQEVVIKRGNNPAHRIIKLASQNRKQNNPANIPEYSYRAYNKFVLTANPDKAHMEDTLRVATTKADSAYLEMQDLLAKHHLLMMESISENAFRSPDQSQETVIATRVSGFKNPSFTVLTTEARSFSIYSNSPFFGKTYLSPLSPGSTGKYDFTLESSSLSGTDSVFIISFKPLEGKNFDGLKGQLHINSNGWAVQNVIAESTIPNTANIRLQQQYQLVNGHQWFPVQVNTDFDMVNMDWGGHYPRAITRTWYTNINLNPGLKSKDFKSVSTTFAPQAHKAPDSLWNSIRPDTLTAKEQRTYTVIDSIGQKEKFDSKLKIYEALLSRKIPLGLVDLDLEHQLRINRYEGVRPGLGFHTSQKVSGFFSLGGYVGYGFKDKAFKYGADLALNLYKPNEVKLTLAYWEDVLESGSVRLPFYSASPLDSKFRRIYVFNMDKITHQSANLDFRALKYATVQLSLREELKRRSDRNPYTYLRSETEPAVKQFQFTEAVVGVRYAFREQRMTMLNNTFSLGTSYPVIWLQFTKGLKGTLNGEYDYEKADARVEKSFESPRIGKTDLSLAGGLTRGQIPYTNLYSLEGSYYKRKFGLYANTGFETMRFGEFLADRYATLHFTHSFKKLLFRTEKFDPVIAVATNIGFGSLQNPERHFERNFVPQSIEKGYYESGLLVSNLLKINPITSVGVAWFYRYGPYSLPKTSDNFVAKLVFAFDF